MKQNVRTKDRMLYLVYNHTIRHVWCNIIQISRVRALRRHVINPTRRKAEGVRSPTAAPPPGGHYVL